MENSSVYPNEGKQDGGRGMVKAIFRRTQAFPSILHQGGYPDRWPGDGMGVWYLFFILNWRVLTVFIMAFKYLAGTGVQQDFASLQFFSASLAEWAFIKAHP
jgi:hypothetical protein